MDMPRKLLHVLLLATFLFTSFPASIGFCQSDWKDYVDDEPTAPPVEEIEDDPAWEKYAFDLPFADDTGRLSFKDLARSGEPFVLFWWLSECPVCHLQMPYVEHLQNQIDEHGLALTIASICIDTDKRGCLEVIREKEISFPVLFDGHARRTKHNYKVSDYGTPLAYLFGAGGVQKGIIDGFQSDFGEIVLSTLEIELPEDEEEAP